MAAKPRPKKAASKKKATKKSTAKKSGAKKTASKRASRARKAASTARKAAAKATSRTRSEGSRLAVSVLDLNKTTFDNAVKAIESMQKHTEKVLKELVDNSQILPGEAKRFLEEWRSLVKRNQQDFTRTVDKSFDLWSGFFERIRRQEAAKAKEAKKAAPKKTKVKVKRKPKKAASKKKAASSGA